MSVHLRDSWTSVMVARCYLKPFLNLDSVPSREGHCLLVNCRLSDFICALVKVLLMSKWSRVANGAIQTWLPS